MKYYDMCWPSWEYTIKLIIAHVTLLITYLLGDKHQITELNQTDFTGIRAMTGIIVK